MGRYHVPVLPDVGSMTTLFPGTNFPSASATSTIRLAILSFTDPPEDIYSTFPTTQSKVASDAQRAWSERMNERTEVTPQPRLLRNLVESDERCVADGAQSITEDSSLSWHCGGQEFGEQGFETWCFVEEVIKTRFPPLRRFPPPCGPMTRIRTDQFPANQIYGNSTIKLKSATRSFGARSGARDVKRR